MQHTLSNEAATQELATRLANALAVAMQDQTSIAISLHGDLGAGKTTLVRFLLHALGITGRIKSPSYAIAEQYPTAFGPVWHCDFYRLTDAREWEDAGFRDTFAGPGLKLVEWPENLPAGYLVYDISLHLQWLADSAVQARTVQLEAHTRLGKELLIAMGLPWAAGHE